MGGGQHWAKGIPGGARAAPMQPPGRKPPGVEAPRCRARCHGGSSRRLVSAMVLGTCQGWCSVSQLPVSAGTGGRRLQQGARGADAWGGGSAPGSPSVPRLRASHRGSFLRPLRRCPAAGAWGRGARPAN